MYQVPEWELKKEYFPRLYKELMVDISSWEIIKNKLSNTRSFQVLRLFPYGCFCGKMRTTYILFGVKNACQNMKEQKHTDEEKCQLPNFRAHAPKLLRKCNYYFSIVICYNSKFPWISSSPNTCIPVRFLGTWMEVQSARQMKLLVLHFEVM